jgi:DNA-3-methyladenine glycosylase II
MSQFVLEPEGPFTLSAIRDFQCGLMAASRSCDAGEREVRLAFPQDGNHRPVGVKLAEKEGRVEATIYGSNEVEVVKAQIARILSLDYDARPYAAMLARDRALEAVSQRHPGFRPPIFFSPYAGAGWLVLTHRIGRARAARLQEAIARAAGDVVEIDGRSIASFPRPETFLRLGGFAGVHEEKWRRLEAIARAALEGELDPARLKAIPLEAACDGLRKIRGIGPWTAEGILTRGTGIADALRVHEPDVLHAVQKAYGLALPPTAEEVVERAQAWRPYRAWVMVLLTADYHRHLVA